MEDCNVSAQRVVLAVLHVLGLRMLYPCTRLDGDAHCAVRFLLDLTRAKPAHTGP